MSLDTLLLILDTQISIFWVYIYGMKMNWTVDTQFIPSVYFLTPNSEFLAKALIYALQISNFEVQSTIHVQESSIQMEEMA